MNATPPEAQHWQRTLWTMVGVQFLMSIAFSILSPIMPLFLPELGVVSTGAVDIWAGVLASVTSFIAIFTAPVWGGLADRYGRKLMVLRSTLGISIFTLLMGIAGNPWHMLSLCGPAWGRSPASIRLPPCWSPPRCRSSAWAIHSGGWEPANWWAP